MLYCFKMAAKSPLFLFSAKMLKKKIQLLFFFFMSKEAYPIVRQLGKKITAKKSSGKGNKMREKQMLVPWDPGSLKARCW